MKRRVLIGIAALLVVALVAVVGFAVVGTAPTHRGSPVALAPRSAGPSDRASSEIRKPLKSAVGALTPGPKSGTGRRFAQQQPVPASVTLRYAAGTTEATKRALVASLGLTVKHEFPGGWVVVESDRAGATSASLAEAIKATGAVATAAPTPRVTPSALPNDPEFASQWDLRNTGQQVGGQFGTSGADIGWLGAWNRGSTGAGVIVAVTDTGADFQHEDLASQMWVNPTPGSDPRYPDDVRGWNWVELSAQTFQPWEGDEHGTHVSGTIAADTNNGVGIAGIASGARIMSLKFIGPATGSEDDAAAAVYYAVAHGAKVINASWGDDKYTGPYQPLRDAIHAAAQQGVLFVAAAGNDATSALFYPAAYSLDETNVIAVAATDNRDQLADFGGGKGSNYGTYPQIAAPGVNTVSLYPPLQAGVFVDKAPFKVSYLTFPVESIVSDTDRNGVVDHAMASLTSDKSAPVLVVDDSRVDLTGETQGTRLDPYLQALAADGYTSVTSWVAATQGIPSAAAMSGHTVVWFTGMLDSASYNFPGVGTINAADRAQLGPFLDGGGRLFLSSASAAWDLTPGPGTTIADSAWLAKYLRVDLVTNAYAAVADGRWDSAFAGLAPALWDPQLNVSYCDAVVPSDPVAVRTIDWAGSGYGGMSGTSMAAPHVTGVVALLTERFPGITGQQVKDRILATGKLLPSLTGKVTTGGRLDVAAALAPYAAQVTALTAVPTLDGTVTLSWTNPADAAYDRTVIRGRVGADPSGPADPASRPVYSGTGVTIDDTGLPGGTQMHYMAYTHSTSGLWSDGVPVAATAVNPPPNAVTSLIGVSMVDGVHLSWIDPTARFTASRVVRGLAATPVLPTDGTLVVDTAAGVVVDAVAVPGVADVVYHYAVFAHDSVPAYSAATVIDVLVPKDAVAPAAPSGVIATAGDLSVSLAWTNPTDADFTATRVLRSTSGYASGPVPVFGQTPVYEGVGTSLPDSPLTNGQAYYYTLFARDAVGNWSVAATATATPRPGSVTGVVGVWRPDLGVVHLTWTNPGGSFAAVTIVRKTGATPAGPSDGTSVADTASSAYDDTVAAPGASDVTYHYALFAHDGTPVYAVGVPVDVVVPVDATPPGPVTGIGLTGAPTRTQVALHWINPTDADFQGVQVFRSTTGFAQEPAADATQALVATINGGTMLADTVPNAGTMYYYALFARDVAGNWSGPSRIQVVTAPDPVTDVMVVRNPTTGAATITWTGPASNPALAGVRIVRSVAAVTGPTEGTFVATVTAGAQYIDTLTARSFDTTYTYTVFSYVARPTYGTGVGSNSVRVLHGDAPQTVWRFYNVRAGVHFYTASTAERDNVLATLGSVYRLEGPAYVVNTASGYNVTPLWRFYNVRTGTHFYTASLTERDSVLANLGSIYRLDGPAYNVSAGYVPGATTVWRFYNVRTGTHFYTASTVERDNVLSTLGSIYHLDGPAFFLAP